MKITIEGEPKEIAALVIAVQERLGELIEEFEIGFPLLSSPDAYARNLVAKDNDVADAACGAE